MTDIDTLPRPTLSADETERLRRVTARASVQKLLGLLNDDKDRTLIVGGAVRNALLDDPVADIDLATTLTPDAVMERASQADVKVVPTGLDHGTLTLVHGGHGFEVTTLRKDIETDGRRATIAYSRSFREDAERRDFTMNALYADAQAVLYDPVAGLDDLRRKDLRFIGDAQTRIREDYLRILRFFRFFANYAAGDINDTGLAACIALKDGLAGLSRERIGHEWLKLLMARRACETIALMQDKGLTETLVPVALHPHRLDALLALLPQAEPMTRLFALLDPDEAQIAACQSALRLSNAQTHEMTALARALADLPQPLATDPLPVTALQVWAFHHTTPLARMALALYCVRNPAPSLAQRQALFDALSAPLAHIPAQSPFSGRDLLSHGVKSGPLLGALLQKLNDLWVEAGCPDDPEALNALVRHVVNQEKDLSQPDRQ